MFGKVIMSHHMSINYRIVINPLCWSGFVRKIKTCMLIFVPLSTKNLWLYPPTLSLHGNTITYVIRCQICLSTEDYSSLVQLIGDNEGKGVKVQSYSSFLHVSLLKTNNKKYKTMLQVSGCFVPRNWAP